MQKGTIGQINVKPHIPGEHGLPKKSVNSVEVTEEGVSGDYNRYRQKKKSGEPEMAVMLIAKEILNDLRKEKWPVNPGDLGENFTTKGLDYYLIKENQKYRIGSALIQISFKCNPCTNLEVLAYVGKEKSTEFIKTLMNRRGWYARVLEKGTVKTGDDIILVD